MEPNPLSFDFHLARRWIDHRKTVVIPGIEVVHLYLADDSEIIPMILPYTFLFRLSVAVS